MKRLLFICILLAIPVQAQVSQKPLPGVDLPETITGAWTFTGALISSAPAQIGSTYYASDFAGADCGLRLTAFEAAVSGPAEFVADNTCPVGTWTATIISHSNHTLRCSGPVQFTVNQIKMAGNFDVVRDCYFIQIGPTDQWTIWSTGNDNWIQNNTLDGSAAQTSTNFLDDLITIQGNRNHVIGNRVIKSQGDDMQVRATSTTGTLIDIEIVRNEFYNANVSAFGTGIAVGTSGPTQGVAVNNILIAMNRIDNVNGDCIFVTSDLTSTALATTPVFYPRVIGNTVSNCGDSAIEVSDVVFQPVIANNTADVTVHAGLLTRDTISPIISNNQVNMEASALQQCISIGPIRFEPATFDSHALVEGNICRGYMGAAAAGAGMQIAHHGVTVRSNDFEYTAGNGAIQTIVDASGTTTIVSDRPLLLPVGKSITVSGTTNYNNTYVLATANDTTRTYTSTTIGGTTAQETSGVISNTTTAGVGLLSECIRNNGAFNDIVIEDNKCRNFNIGIDLDFGGGVQSISENRVKGNFISKVGIGINIANVTFTNSEISHNYVEQVLTGFIQNGSSTGSNNSYILNNQVSLTGWTGATPYYFSSGNPPPNTFGYSFNDLSSKISGNTNPINWMNGPIVMQTMGFGLVQNGGQGALGYGNTNRWAMTNNGAAQDNIVGLATADTFTAVKTFGAGSSLNFTALLASPTAPTIAAAGCGGSAASISTNNGTASFNINVGTAPTAGGCTVTMPAAANGWNCTGSDVTTNSTSVAFLKQFPAASQTTTQIVMQNFSDVAVATAPTASDIWRIHCFAN